MLTLTQVGEALGLEPSTLRHQIRNGRLRATKVGRDWVVRPADVEKYRRDVLGQRGRKNGAKKA